MTDHDRTLSTAVTSTIETLSATDTLCNDIATLNTAVLDIAAIVDTAKLPQTMTPPILQAQYKAVATDFVVNEILQNTFTGDGEHLWLHIQKMGMNTAYLAKLLAEWADIPLRDVGYSGLKDRHALTTQWFSLRIPKKQLPSTEFMPIDIGEGENIQILDQHWHHKKLGRGAHRANQFIITLRDIQLTDVGLNTEQLLIAKQKIAQHLEQMSKMGVPNYFGSQRFGHGGNNIKEALRLFTELPKDNVKSDTKSKVKNKRKRAPKEQHTMALSAARSLIFNEILAARVRDGSWNTGMSGEVFNLNGSGSIFAVEQMDDDLRARLIEGDIHPTAPLWGVDNDKVSGTAAILEHDVVQKNPVLTQLAVGLTQHNIKAQRRALRLPIEEMTWEWQDEKTLILSFNLPTGSFATSVLAALVQRLQL